MNKKELLSAVSQKAGVTQKVSQDVLNAFQKVILECLEKDGEVVLLDLGKFKVVERAARTGINPLTKQPMSIPAKKKPSLVASKKFKTFVEDSGDVDSFNY